MKSFTKTFDWFCAHLGWISGSLGALMMIMICVEIFRRYVLRDPTSLTIELTSYLLVAMVYLGAAWTTLNEKNVRVDILYAHFHGKMKKVADASSYIAGILYSGVLFWYGGTQALATLCTGVVSTQPSRLPMFPMHVLLPVGALLVMMVLFIKFYRTLKEPINS